MTEKYYNELSKIPFTSAWYLELYDKCYDEWITYERIYLNAIHNSDENIRPYALGKKCKYEELMGFIKRRISGKLIPLEKELA